MDALRSLRSRMRDYYDRNSLLYGAIDIRLLLLLHTRVHIYPVMLCVSTVFAVGRCPSDCPSDAFVYCIPDGAVVKLLTRPGPCADAQFQGKPLQREHQIHGRAKKIRFSSEIAVYLGNGTR